MLLVNVYMYNSTFVKANNLINNNKVNDHKLKIETLFNHFVLPYAHGALSSMNYLYSSNQEETIGVMFN